MSDNIIKNRKEIEGYPGWVWKDCYCYAGIVSQWGEPVECPNCNGTGRYAVHVKTGVIKDWPGGKFI